MAYRDDPDLNFFKYLRNDDLADLLKILTTDKDGEKRYSQELTSSEGYKKYYSKGQHIEYWHDIAGELQKFGGNSLLNIFRAGKGVPYREILIDVCEKMKVNFDKKSPIGKIEQKLINKIFEDAIDKMSEEDRKVFVQELKLSTTGFTKQAVLVAVQAGLRMGGFMTYQLAVIVANAVAKQILGKGLAFAASATLTRSIAVFIGPVGWILTGVWTAVDLAGPAYRVTIPAVLQVAMLRLKHEQEGNQ